MTGNTDKVRAVFLAALMIFSVFAGTVAFSGSAAATNANLKAFDAPSETINGGESTTVSSAVLEDTSSNSDLVRLNNSSVSLTTSSLSASDISGVELQIGGTTIAENNSVERLNDIQFGNGSAEFTSSGPNSSLSAFDNDANDELVINDNALETIDIVVNTASSADGTITGETFVARIATPQSTSEDFSGSVSSSATTNSNTLTIDLPGTPELESAVHYDNDTSTTGQAGEIELEFSEDVNNVGSIAVYDDDQNVTGAVTDTIDNGAQVKFELGTGESSIRTGDVQVNLDFLEDDQGNTISDDGNNSVTFAPVPIKGRFDANRNETNVYQGGNATIIANSTDTTITIEGDDNNYFFDGSTGDDSQVFVFRTENRELGDYNISIDGSDATRTQAIARDLGLDATVDDLNVTTDDTIEIDVSAAAGNRQTEVELLDSSGDDINTTEATTDGAGERTFEFNTASADDGDELDTGDYTVRVTDQFSGVDLETSEITVSQADDESAEFTSNTITDERGDILEVTVDMTETSEATLSFGSQDDGVIANATVEDENDDNQVTVFINTYRFNQSLPVNGEVYNIDSDSDDSIVDQDITVQTQDLVDAGNYDLEVEAGDVDDSGGNPAIDSSDDVATVTLDNRNTENVRMWTGSSEEIGSVSDLEDVNEALNEDQITQSSEIAVGDLAVHQIQFTGFEGALDARANEDVTGNFFSQIQAGPLNLTIEEASPGANQDASELIVNSSNTDVVADGPNDTYYVVVDTGDMAFDGPRDEQLPSDDDTSLETNFTVLRDNAADDQGFTTGSGTSGNYEFGFTNTEFDDDENEETFVTFNANEPEVNIDEPFNVSQASGQTVSGDTNIAPGTELTLRIRSQDGVSPSFLKTASPVVQPDGTFSSTFDFSEQNVGDEYDIEVDANLLGSTESEEGEVVEGVATATPEPDTDTATPEPDTATPEPDTATPEPDTATPEPDTATPEPDTDTPTSTPTSTPGFGVVVALTALLAAALLAVRRD